MMGRLETWKACILLACGAVIALAGMGAVAATPGRPAAEGDLYSIVRGGRLYDSWFAETGEQEPRKSHPAYPSDAAFANDPGTNWRCKECHGWDYKGRDGGYARGKHYTGIKGIGAMAGTDTRAIIAVLKDKTHAYRKHRFSGLDSRRPPSREEIIAIFRDRRGRDSGWMEDRDFRDLASFVAHGQIDMDRFIDRDTGKGKGDVKAGETYYVTICTTCHGRDGLKVKSMTPMGKIAAENPWETLHKILNGHPGIMMPPFRILGVEVSADILAYAQTLPREQILASVVRGGRLYDNWHKEAKKAVPGKPHFAYPRDKTFANKPAITWRCKECHGWDYQGRDGAYSKGKHYTGIKGINGMADADPEAIIAILKDDTHEFGRVLENRDLRDLARFVGKGQVDMGEFIDRASGKAIGNADKGVAFYTTLCATCHGMDGLGIITMRPLGYFARRNPWETLHKVLNGHPNRIMPPLRVLETQVLVNVLAYAQGLPGER